MENMLGGPAWGEGGVCLPCLRQKQTFCSPEKLQSEGQSLNPSLSSFHSQRMRRHLPLAPPRPSPRMESTPPHPAESPVRREED